ncbi:hypothetical protein FQN49_005845 [Arthroderma sp. PD_2]|nr:hypothetical protein FQN49_005845 [Arthroderma sp. PD_2]
MKPKRQSRLASISMLYADAFVVPLELTYVQRSVCRLKLKGDELKLKLKAGDAHSGLVGASHDALLFARAGTELGSNQKTKQLNINNNNNRQTDTRPMQVSIYAAIFDDGCVFKHWALFVDGPTPSTKLILNTMGSESRFRYEQRTANAREDETLLELHRICDIDASKVPDIAGIAEKVPIRNDIPSWNCQDFVFDVVNALEGQVEMDDGYKERLESLRLKQDGLI